MERCLCLLDGLHGGERVVCGKYYLYMKPRGCNKYYTLYEEDKIKNKYICSIYVDRYKFDESFLVEVCDLDNIDNMFNAIMDGKVYM